MITPLLHTKGERVSMDYEHYLKMAHCQEEYPHLVKIVEMIDKYMGEQVRGERAGTHPIELRYAVTTAMDSIKRYEQLDGAA